MNGRHARLRVAATAAAALLLAAGLAVRLTVRDRLPVASAVFYATPWPVLAALAASSALLLARRRRRLALALGVVALACAGSWLDADLRLVPPAGDLPPRAFRIAYWNVAHPEARVPRLAARILSWDADLVALGEARPAGRPFPPAWQQALAPCAVTPLRQFMLLASRGPATELRAGDLAGHGDYSVQRVSVGGRDVTLIVVDLDGEPLHSREEAFERIASLVTWYGSGPLVLLGDFNTPGDSTWFDALREKLDDAFDAAGDGFAATWPEPLPVLSLDHVLVSRDLRVLHCAHRGSWLSDHRAVVVDLAWAADVSPGAPAR